MDIKNTLIEALLNRNKIQSKDEILKLVEDYKKKFNIKPNKDIIKYLSRHNYIRKIFKSYYYINSFDERERGFSSLKDYEVIFTVLNKMDLMWYAGMGYSLYLQGKTWQTPNQISIVNTKFSGMKQIFGLKTRFFKLDKDFFFGLKNKKTPNGVSFLLSDPAKTYIDMVYFKQTKKLTGVKNTQKYLKRYPKWHGRK
jgi:predicted transcriptional regulator of viral defense system